MYFLSDVSEAQFAQKVEEKPVDKKIGMLRKGFQFVVGKTPMGTLTRAASVAGIGGSLYGVSKMRKPTHDLISRKIRMKHKINNMFGNVKNAMTSDTAKGIGASAVGTVAGGLALNEGRKLYEKKTRKWWEVL